MAFALHNYALAILLLVIIPFEGTYGSHHHQHKHKHQHLKSLHFSLFQHETVNKTGYIIVNGVEGGPRITATTAPFGTIFVFQDPLTVTANRSSKVVGIDEGTTFTTSNDGLLSLSIAKLTLRLKHHKGSISVVGGTNNIKASNLPVVGGTEDFLFVQGYVTASPVDLKGLAVVYKVEFHLYWPPYATQAS
ncbi:dirigent protein 19-like [Gastrolobium bilobum]|uniref:dirigent protein 19-like n=1 Tax=Gastrolobium bilobum TaxID=150636 RepID=UPI002AAF319A|nr:dirigent protein 19-like [Gastrolobium bilobum]